MAQRQTVIAGVNNANGYSDGDGWSPMTAMIARLDGNLGRAVRLEGLGLYLAGRGGARQVQFFVKDSGGAYIAGSGLQTIGSGSGTTFHGLGIWGFMDGIGQQLQYGYDNSPGIKNFGRQQPGVLHTSTGDYDGYLGGTLYWSECPSAPTTPAIEQLGGGRVRVTFSGAGVDDGGTGITGWLLKYATNAGMSGATVIDSSGTSELDLTPGQQYWFAAAGRNGVVDALGRAGVWSGISTAVVIGGGKVRRAGAWVDAKTKIRGGGVWKDATVQVRKNGAWVPAV